MCEFHHETPAVMVGIGKKGRAQDGHVIGWCAECVAKLPRDTQRWEWHDAFSILPTVDFRKMLE